MGGRSFSRSGQWRVERSSALSLRAAMARRSRRAPALRQRWARACAPRSGEMVGWALDPEWHWRDPPRDRW